MAYYDFVKINGDEMKDTISYFVSILLLFIFISLYPIVVIGDIVKDYYKE